MRIGINASFLRKQNTGIGQVTYNFLRKLAEFASKDNAGAKKRKIEFFLYMEKDSFLDFLEDPKIPEGMFKKRVFLPIYKRDDLIRKIWWEKYLLPKKAKEDGCDIFLSLYQSPTIFKEKSIMHVMVVHDIIPVLFGQYLNNRRKKLYQKYTNAGIKKAGKIIAISHRTEKDLIQHMNIGPEKISVCYVDVDEIYKKEVSTEESKRVLAKYKLEPGYIYNGGGLEVRKNAEGVLRAYKILAEQAGRIGKLPKLVISGKMMPQLAPLITDVQQLVEGLELQEHVKLLDFISQEDLPALYRNAMMFVYPSFYEGFGLPILEAMNQGIPVITSKTSSLPEVGSDSVLYCNPEKIDDLAMVMRNMINNDKLRSMLAIKGKERSGHFSWDKFVSKILHVMAGIKKGTDPSPEQYDDMAY